MKSNNKTGGYIIVDLEFALEVGDGYRITRNGVCITSFVSKDFLMKYPVDTKCFFRIKSLKPKNNIK